MERNLWIAFQNTQNPINLSKKVPVILDYYKIPENTADIYTLQSDDHLSGLVQFVSKNQRGILLPVTTDPNPTISTGASSALFSTGSSGLASSPTISKRLITRGEFIPFTSIDYPFPQPSTLTQLADDLSKTPSLIKHINPPFTLIDYIPSKNHLKVHHDFLGVAPVYHYQTQSLQVWSNHIAPIFLITNLKPTPNPIGIQCKLTLGYMIGDHTPYNQIKKLLPPDPHLIPSPSPSPSPSPIDYDNFINNFRHYWHQLFRYMDFEQIKLTLSLSGGRDCRVIIATLLDYLNSITKPQIEDLYILTTDFTNPIEFDIDLQLIDYIKDNLPPEITVTHIKNPAYNPISPTTPQQLESHMDRWFHINDGQQPLTFHHCFNQSIYCQYSPIQAVNSLIITGSYGELGKTVNQPNFNTNKLTDRFKKWLKPNIITNTQKTITQTINLISPEPTTSLSKDWYNLFILHQSFQSWIHLDGVKRLYPYYIPPFIQQAFSLPDHLKAQCFLHKKIVESTNFSKLWNDLPFEDQYKPDSPDYQFKYPEVKSTWYNTLETTQVLNLTTNPSKPPFELINQTTYPSKTRKPTWIPIPKTLTKTPHFSKYYQSCPKRSQTKHYFDITFQNLWIQALDKHIRKFSST